MWEQNSARQYLETGVASGIKRSAGPALPSPRKNHLLAALPEPDYERLLPLLEAVPLPRGLTIHGADEREHYLYFLTAGIVSRYYVFENGASGEVAVTGNEGVIGIASFLGGHSTPSQAMVLSAGSAYRLRTSLLKEVFAGGDALLHLLLRYTLALIAQAGQTAVCNRHHSVQQQLCFWILSCLDRSPSNELTITQEVIGKMLGVRREGITEAAGNLQKTGIVQCRRGHITVIDRPRLELAVCECYAAVKRECDRLLHCETTINGPAVSGIYRQ